MTRDMRVNVPRPCGEEGALRAMVVPVHYPIAEQLATQKAQRRQKDGSGTVDALDVKVERLQLFVGFLRVTERTFRQFETGQQFG